MTKEELIDTLGTIFPGGKWPKPLHVLKALQMVHSGADVREAAKSVGTSASVVAAAQGAKDLGGISWALVCTRRTSSIGTGRDRSWEGLLLGRCAEVAFERIYKAEMHTEEFELRDLREGRTDTDYRLHNGRGRPIYRVNIKFHGSQFRRAQEMVGLETADCFALATYKIYGALQKQEEERLPYFFAIVGVPNLTGEAVGRQIPSFLVETVALIDQAPRGKSKETLRMRP